MYIYICMYVYMQMTMAQAKPKTTSFHIKIRICRSSSTCFYGHSFPAWCRALDAWVELKQVGCKGPLQCLEVLMLGHIGDDSCVVFYGNLSILSHIIHIYIYIHIGSPNMIFVYIRTGFTSKFPVKNRWVLPRFFEAARNFQSMSRLWHPAWHDASGQLRASWLGSQSKTKKHNLWNDISLGKS